MKKADITADFASFSIHCNIDSSRKYKFLIKNAGYDLVSYNHTVIQFFSYSNTTKRYFSLIPYSITYHVNLLDGTFLITIVFNGSLIVLISVFDYSK